MNEGETVSVPGVIIIPCPAVIYVTATLALRCSLGQGHEGMHEIKIKWDADVAHLQVMP